MKILMFLVIVGLAGGIYHSNKRLNERVYTLEFNHEMLRKKIYSELENDVTRHGDDISRLTEALRLLQLQVGAPYSAVENWAARPEDRSVGLNTIVFKLKDDAMELEEGFCSGRNSPMSKGGPRKGAGRPATGKTRKLYNLNLKPDTIEELHTYIPRGKRSQWIEETILANLP